VQAATATTGRRVAAGEVLATLVANKEAELQFSISERDYRELLKDDAPIIGRTISFVGGGGEMSETKIARVLPVQPGRSGTVTLSADTAIDGTTFVMPGSFVTVEVPGRSYPNAVKVNESAIFEGNTIYLIDNGALAPHAATLLGFEGDDAILAGDGIAGKQILSTRLADIAIGQKVEVSGAANVKPASPDAPAPSPNP
jgi:multidrug efflux pump subunit AcrA (membrane-fusion protein)